MKIICILFVCSIFLVGCVSPKIDMTEFELDDFIKIESHCNVNRDCKIIEFSYLECGGYDAFAYSSTIRGENEEQLINLAKKNYEKTRSEIIIEVCNGAAKRPPKGFCNNNVCDIKYTWKKI